jgi:hypothetical protein
MGHTAFDRASARVKKYLQSKYSTVQAQRAQQGSTTAAGSVNVPDCYKDNDSFYVRPPVPQPVPSSPPSHASLCL